MHSFTRGLDKVLLYSQFPGHYAVFMLFVQNLIRKWDITISVYFVFASLHKLDRRTRRGDKIHTRSDVW